MRITLFLFLAAGLLSQNALADETGSCGPSCTYTLKPVTDENGDPVMVTYREWVNWGWVEHEGQAQTLTISGTGNIETPFYHNGTITSISIGEGITSIGGNNADKDEIFSSLQNLESVTLPSTLTTITAYSFANNPKLTSIDLPNGLITIGRDAFNSTAITDIKIPASVVSIGSRAFTTSSLQSIIIEGDYVNFSSKQTGCYYGVCDGAINDVFIYYTDHASGYDADLKNLYCSKEMENDCRKIVNDMAAFSGKTPANLTVFEKDGPYYKVGNNRYSSLENMKKNQAVRRIYSVEEAERASKPTGNKFMIRYK